MTHFSECHLMNVKWNDEIDEWFKYSYTGFYLNTHDDSVMRYAGADFPSESFMQKCVMKNVVNL